MNNIQIILETAWNFVNEEQMCNIYFTGVSSATFSSKYFS